ncbi:MAG: HlyD family efflux transporter periplasmic adaptor subunit, partial [Prevotella nigrescens]|nr:HlyD family efflux transporter periplasmic adaptor subunit [Prevotella nigrescens]
RHIIGEIPSGIVRYGITIITIVILGLLVGAYFIPYPETISAKIEMADRRQGTVAIPYQYVNTVKKGMNVSIELEGYDTEMYGVTNGTITAISSTPQHAANGNIFVAKVNVKNCKYNIEGGMVGTASILVSNESMLQRILQRVTSSI